MSHGNRSFADWVTPYAVSPQLVDDAAVSSAWIPVFDAHRVTAIVVVGATDIEVDAKLEQATDSSGTGAKDVTGAAIVQMTATDDNEIVTIDLDTEHMDISNGSGFDHLRLTITVGNGTTGAYVAGVILKNNNSMPPAFPAAYTQQIEVAG